VGSDLYAVDITVEDKSSDQVLATAPEGFHLSHLGQVDAWSRLSISVTTIHPDVEARGLVELFTVRLLQEAWEKRSQTGPCPILAICSLDELIRGRDSDGAELDLSRFPVSIEPQSEDVDSCQFAAVVPSSWVVGIDGSQSLESRAFE